MKKCYNFKTTSPYSVRSYVFHVVYQFRNGGAENSGSICRALNSPLTESLCCVIEHG